MAITQRDPCAFTGRISLDHAPRGTVWEIGAEQRGLYVRTLIPCPGCNLGWPARDRFCRWCGAKLHEDAADAG